MRLTVLLLSLVILPFALLACGGEPASEEPTEPASEASANGSEAPIGPVRSQGSSPPPPATTPPAGTTPGQLDFTFPDHWQEEPPSSGMRMAQAKVPGEAGPADVVVFYFGPGGGGGVEANIDRWVGQMEVAAGTQPERGSFEANGYRVTHVTVEGTLLPSGMGTGPTEPQPDSMLIGAVVEGPGGPWFFKATGPIATLEGEREGFMGMLRGL